MRRKPSMFSKNYRKELKQRKIRRIVLLFGAVLIIGGIAFSYDKGSVLVKNYFAENKKDSVIEKDNEENENEETVVLEEQNEDATQEDILETFEVKLNSGKGVLVELKDDNNKKVISNMQCPEEVKGIISPTAEKGLLLDESTQDIYIVDTAQQMKNVTNSQYIATNKEVFFKESVLQYNPQYKWVEGAAFIDETHVAYSSQLPWINEGGERYLWIVNIEDNTHKGYYNIKGSTFRFGETKPEGVTIEIDGRTIVVNSLGKVVSN